MAANPRIFVNSIQIPIGAALGDVLTSDASGNASWAPAAGSTKQRTFAFFAS